MKLDLTIDSGDDIDREIRLYPDDNTQHGNIVLHVTFGPRVERNCFPGMDKGFRKPHPDDISEVFLLTPEARLKLVQYLLNA